MWPVRLGGQLREEDLHLDIAHAPPCVHFLAQRHLDNTAWWKARLGKQAGLGQEVRLGKQAGLGKEVRLGKQAGLGPGEPGKPHCGVWSRPECAGHPWLVFKENNSII